MRDTTLIKILVLPFLLCIACLRHLLAANSSPSQCEEDTMLSCFHKSDFFGETNEANGGMWAFVWS